eukprot:1686697-Rhodomonas_salina.2
MQASVRASGLGFAARKLGCGEPRVCGERAADCPGIVPISGSSPLHPALSGLDSAETEGETRAASACSEQSVQASAETALLT